MELKDLLTETNENIVRIRLSEEKDKLISLCRDFNGNAFAAEPIKIITDLMNCYFNQSEINPSITEVKDITYQMTTLISFLAYLHENVEMIKHLENHE